MKLNRTLLDSARAAGTPASVSSLHDVVALQAAPRRALRRLAFWAPVLALTGLGVGLGVSLTAGSASILRWPLLALMAVNLLYLAVSAWPGILGLFAGAGRAPRQAAASPSGTSRTAVLLPIYNEDVAPVFAAVETMALAVSQAGLPNVHFFVLSDSTDPAIAARESGAHRALLARLPASATLHYRRRLVNARRKVGNIADFCHRWGGEYDYMLVLDADSLMGAEAIRTLIGLMDANPSTAIVQTIPYAVGRDTLFARVQQFAARLYTPLLVEGLRFWQQAEANYWGHNAIIRIAPFVQHCELPVLRGREPFGGEILCHDVVEAALLQRAGWEIWLLPESLDSYESLPANMVDYAQRERRWCQGNLQHLGVLGLPGLGAMGRYHLGLGIAHYLAGPLAVLFAIVATLDSALGGSAARMLLLGGGAAWFGLLLVLGFVLYGAKLAALGWTLVSADRAEAYGGRVRLLASAALEQAFAFVLSPVLLLFYTRYLTLLLLGLSVRWDAQPRDDRGVSWHEARRCMAWAGALGAAWAGALALVDAGMLAWGAPLFAGLLLAVPVTAWSSRATLGRAARRMGLFLTCDETEPAPILRAYRRVMALPPLNLPPLNLPAAGESAGQALTPSASGLAGGKYPDKLLSKDRGYRFKRVSTYTVIAVNRQMTNATS